MTYQINLSLSTEKNLDAFASARLDNVIDHCLLTVLPQVNSLAVTHKLHTQVNQLGGNVVVDCPKSLQSRSIASIERKRFAVSLSWTSKSKAALNINLVYAIVDFLYLY